MKIEKVNDNQIRCTLTKDDLASRQLKLSELAYGTEKAKSLFRDMMQQASYEFGFEAEDIPLMIEAIPLSTECIVLIITKVEYPEELDTRFSKFAPSAYDENEIADFMESTGVIEGADDVLGLFKKVQKPSDSLKPSGNDKNDKNFAPLPETLKERILESIVSEDETPITNLTKLYLFQNLNEVTRLAQVLNNFYNGCNVLYKNNIAKKYYLVLNKDEHTPEEFNKVCNILSEYAHQEKYTPGVEAYFQEHYDIILKENALQTLGQL